MKGLLGNLVIGIYSKLSGLLVTVIYINSSASTQSAETTRSCKQELAQSPESSTLNPKPLNPKPETPKP